MAKIIVIMFGGYLVSRWKHKFSVECNNSLTNAEVDRRRIGEAETFPTGGLTPDVLGVSFALAPPC